MGAARLADASVRLLFAGLLATICSVAVFAGRNVVDSALRKVDVPDRIERVVAAGPPASVLMTILAPEKLVGWNRTPLPEDLPYLPAIVRSLPEIGRLTGRGGTANLEVIMAAKPDLIVDFGSVSDTYISLADRVQNQTGIPYVLLDGRFANTLAAVRLLGNILGVDERAEQLARRMEEILREVDRAKEAVPPEARPRVYLARGNRGLETGNRGSINTEIIERAGATNVVEGGPLLGRTYQCFAGAGGGLEPGHHRDRRTERGGLHPIGAVLVADRGGAPWPGLPQPPAALWVGRFAPVPQPSGRAAMAGAAVVSGAVLRRYSSGCAKFLSPVLSGRSERARARQTARQDAAEALTHHNFQNYRPLNNKMTGNLP